MLNVPDLSLFLDTNYGHVQELHDGSARTDDHHLLNLLKDVKIFIQY